MENKKELDYIDAWYRKLKGTEYVKDYSELRFFDNTYVSIHVTKKILKKFNPKEEKHVVIGEVFKETKNKERESVIKVTYIL